MFTPEQIGKHSAAIKKKPEDFIAYLENNSAVLKDCINLCMKTDEYESHYEKRLASLCADIFSGDYGNIADLFIREIKCEDKEE